MTESKTPRTNEHAEWLRYRAASPYFAVARLGLLDAANAIERLESAIAAALAAKERAESERDALAAKLAEAERLQLKQSTPPIVRYTLDISDGRMVKSPDGFWASAYELAAAYTTIATLTSKLAEAESGSRVAAVEEINSMLESVMYPPPPYEVKVQEDYFSGATAYRNSLKAAIDAAISQERSDERYSRRHEGAAMRGHTDRAEAEMAVHVTALTKPIGELIEAVLRKHHRAVLEALRELHEATLAPYPTFEQGAEAQNAWSERIDRARDRARAVIGGRK